MVSSKKTSDHRYGPVHFTTLCVVAYSVGWIKCYVGAAHFTDGELHFCTLLDTQPFHWIQIQDKKQYKYNIKNNIYLVFVSSSI